MKTWLRQHAYACSSAFAYLRAGTGNFLFNVLVVAIALALPIMGLTLIENLRPIAKELSIEPEISLFLKADVARADATALSVPIKRLLRDQHIQAKLSFIPKEKALGAMQGTSNLADILSTLGHNPLPDAYLLAMASEDAGKIDDLVLSLQKIQGVDLVQVDSAWVKRLAAMLQILQLCMLLLALTLAIVVIVVVFNATRLLVISHQAEISIARLLGATNSFIRKPYYYTGAMLGGLAGGLALGAVALSLHPLNSAITEFAKLYASEYSLLPLTWLPSILLLLVSMLLGLIGAHLSVRQQLAHTN